MLKYILIFFITICLWTAPVSAAKEKRDLLQENYYNRVKLYKIHDALLQALLKVPFEKRVYVYPALFESDDMPKKITTHPQILPWKGKKPTKIAPQLQEYAKEHLDYMPAKFYPILDPDGWPNEDKESDWHHVTQMIPDALASPSKTQLHPNTK